MATAEMDSGSEMAVTVLAESQTEAPEAPEAQETQETQETQEAQATREERFECHVCLEDVPTTRRWKECPNGAQVCHNCLRQQLVVAIDNSMFTSEGQVACPCGGGCGFAFDEALAEEFLLPVKMLKFKQRARTVLVERDPLKHWCPVPGCDGVATCGDDRQTRAQCPDCSTRFCAKCGVQHSGWVPCSMVADREFEAWTRSKNNVVNVFADGVKCCPACGFAIEKEGGCPHMSCSRCSHSFCWNCLSKWDDASYSCTLGYPACWIKQTWNMSMWGRHPATRAVSRAVGYPVVVAGGIGAAGAAVGLAVAAGAVALPVMGGVAAWEATGDFRRRHRDQRDRRNRLHAFETSMTAQGFDPEKVRSKLSGELATGIVFCEPGLFDEVISNMGGSNYGDGVGMIHSGNFWVRVHNAATLSDENLEQLAARDDLVVLEDTALFAKATKPTTPAELAPANRRRKCMRKRRRGSHVQKKRVPGLALQDADMQLQRSISLDSIMRCVDDDVWYRGGLSTDRGSPEVEVTNFLDEESDYGVADLFETSSASASITLGDRKECEETDADAALEETCSSVGLSAATKWDEDEDEEDDDGAVLAWDCPSPLSAGLPRPPPLPATILCRPQPPVFSKSDTPPFPPPLPSGPLVTVHGGATQTSSEKHHPSEWKRLREVHARLVAASAKERSVVRLNIGPQGTYQLTLAHEQLNCRGLVDNLTDSQGYPLYLMPVTKQAVDYALRSVMDELRLSSSDGVGTSPKAASANGHGAVAVDCTC